MIRFGMRSRLHGYANLRAPDPRDTLESWPYPVGIHLVRSLYQCNDALLLGCDLPIVRYVSRAPDGLLCFRLIFTHSCLSSGYFENPFHSHPIRPDGGDQT